VFNDQAKDVTAHYYRQMLEQLPVAVYTCDLHGHVTQYNTAAAELWGSHPVIGKDMWHGSLKMYRADGTPLDYDDCPMAVTLRDRRPVHGHEVIIERPDGSTRRVAPFPSPLFNTEKEMVGAVNMLRDVTDEQVFREKSAYYTAIVSGSDDAIISKTLEGIVTSWNSAARRIFGYTAEEMIGQPILKLIPDDRKTEEPEILSRLRRGERVDHFETKRVTKTGELLDISLTISPIKDATGRIIGVSKVARDITIQKSAEARVRESEERFRMVVTSTHLGTWEFSPLSGNLSWSEECRSIYDVPKELPATFDLFTKLTHPDDVDFVQSAIQRAMDPDSGGDYDIRFRILRYSDGQIRWVRSQGKVFFNNILLAEKFIGTVLDITEEKLAKVALEEKVAERTKDLRDANQKLALSNNELEQFAFVASHDLQEPLRKIQAFGDMLKDKLPENAGPQLVDYVNRMQSASARMKILIDSLLAFSRVSFNQSEHQFTNLTQLVNGVLADLETVIKEKNATVHVSKLFPVKGEPLHLRQLFQNLIGNALKFTREDRKPEIHISACLLEGKASGMQIISDDESKTFQLIEISDNGIGFEPEYSKKIFGLFQRLHGKQEYPGSGMGLSIVQKVVSNHGGYIEAHSTAGEGATFRILLPGED
jgi:PAS domain S-box-containing protein